MRKINNNCAPEMFSMDTFSPPLNSIENRGAFYDKLSNRLQLHKIRATNKQKSFDDICLSRNECAYVLDFFQNKVLYTKGFKELLGYDKNEITNDFIRQLYHPDDAEIIKRLYETAVFYTMNHPEKSSNNTLFISFRIRRKNGSYLMVLSKATIFEKDKMGRVIRSLVKFTNISFMDKTTNVNWEFKTKNLKRNIFKQQIFKAFQKIFTNRETSTIVLINKGFTNKEIAIKLKISEFTVATHRKNILKKAKCHNSEELILFCKGKGII